MFGLKKIDSSSASADIREVKSIFQAAGTADNAYEIEIVPLKRIP